MKFVKSTLIAITILCVLSLISSRRVKSKDFKIISKELGSVSNDDGKVTALSGQNVQCPTGSAINQFRLYFNAKEKKINYKYTCLSNGGIKGDKIRQVFTDYNVHDGDGGATNYLDRHHMKCATNEVIESFQLQRDSSNKKIRYQYTCVEAITDGCYDKETEWTRGGKNYDVQELQEQKGLSVIDKSNQAIQEIRLHTKYLNGFEAFFSSYNVEYRYRIRICNIKDPIPPKIENQDKENLRLQILKLDGTEREDPLGKRRRRKL